MTTPTVASPPRPTEPASPRPRRRFNVTEYYAMAESGILAHGERVELLDGEIILMAPIGNRHQSSIDRLGERFTLALRERANVRVQGPLRLDDSSEVQPDVALLRRRDDYYATGHPGPQDALLAIEVSDSALDFDRNVKLPLYARAGIAEVWIVNRRDRRVETYAEPAGDAYRSIRHYHAGESVAPAQFTDIALPVAQIVPA